MDRANRRTQGLENLKNNSGDHSLQSRMRERLPHLLQEEQAAFHLGVLGGDRFLDSGLSAFPSPSIPAAQRSVHPPAP